MLRIGSTPDTSLPLYSVLTVPFGDVAYNPGAPALLASKGGRMVDEGDLVGLCDPQCAQ
jgi:hypothetical protein